MTAATSLSKLPIATLVPGDTVFRYTAVALIVTGFVAMSSASIEYAAEATGNPLYYVQRYGMFLLMSLALAVIVSQLPMSLWQRASGLLLLVGFVLLALVLIPGIGKSVNGSRRWLDFGFVTVQVSELVKLLVVIYLSGYLVRRNEELQEKMIGFIKPMVVLFLVVLLLMQEPDFGATVVTSCTALALIFLGGVRLGQFIAVLGSAIAAAVLLVVTSEYRMQRITAYTDPWADQFASGYQLVQSLIAFGRGEWFGLGLGNSIQKLFYLPEAHTDFVFAIWAEEFGLLGVLFALLLFIALFARMFAIGNRAFNAQLPFQGFVTYGIAIMLCGQVFINIGVTSGLLPTKGLTLPFWSYGGSSLMMCFVMLAMVGRVHYETLKAEEGRNG